MFLTAAGSRDNKIHDEALFEEFDIALGDKSKKKVIFLQLAGAHLRYKNRYPNSYDVFTNSDNIEYKNKKINSYDNAILYNDYIVNTIIEKVNKKNTTSFVLYFSDHGEEVYDTIDFSGHNEDVGTLPMFQIPFILWQSELHKKASNVTKLLNRPYMIDDLFHSIADLCGITDKNVNSNRSIFSETYINKKRVILENKNYDSLLLKMSLRK